MDLTLQVGKYEVQKHLGKGATGTVYLAKDTFTGKEVALKTIEPEVFRDPEFGTVYRSQFLQEASLAGTLRPPSIGNILEAGGSPAPGSGTVYRPQFLQEASLAGKLRHPYIVNIPDAVVGEDSGHIAMELVTGGALSKHVTSGKLLPLPDVLQIGFKCCGALEYAAKEG